jgi:hypothetical protein
MTAPKTAKKPNRAEKLTPYQKRIRGMSTQELVKEFSEVVGKLVAVLAKPDDGVVSTT